MSTQFALFGEGEGSGEQVWLVALEHPHGLGSAGVARVRAQSREDALRRALRGRAGLRAVSCEPATLGLFVGR